jgi:hypothetical protein
VASGVGGGNEELFAPRASSRQGRVAITNWWDDRGGFASHQTTLRAGNSSGSSGSRCCWYFRRGQATTCMEMQHRVGENHVSRVLRRPIAASARSTRGLALMKVSQNQTAAWLRWSVAQAGRARISSAGVEPLV